MTIRMADIIEPYSPSIDVTDMIPFDLAKCDPLKVVQVGNMYRVLDGKRRYKMLKLCGVEDVNVQTL